jgi:hypothetical protein
VTTPQALSRHAAPAAWLSVTLAALAGFWWSLPLYFVGDDFAYVWRFSTMDWSHWPRLFLREWSEGLWNSQLRELRPMAALSFMIDARLWGGAASGYHGTNLLLHVACSLVVMLIARDVLKRGWGPAAAAGALFAVHPAHVEAVTWITGRADLLGTLGCLAGFYALVRYRSSRTVAWLVLSWCAWLAGIFSKEFCLILPLLLIAFDLIYTRPASRADVGRLLWPYVGFAMLAGVYYWCRTQALGPNVGAAGLEWGTKDFWRQIAQREFVYLGELFWPVASWLPVANEQRRLALQVLLRTVGVVLLAAGVLWRVDRRQGATDARAVLFFLIPWFLLATMPFVVTYISARHLYLASAGICLGLVALLARFVRQPAVFAGIALVLVVGCERRLFKQGDAWRRGAERSSDITRAVAAVAKTAAPGEALLISAPGLIDGVWVWSWSSPFALRPPFQDRDVTAALIVLEHRAVYFHPDSWPTHPSIARLREYAGPVSVVTGEDGVQIRRVTGEEFVAARRTLVAPLESPGMFEQLIATLKARP